jgi:hypothetical protein
MGSLWRHPLPSLNGLAVKQSFEMLYEKFRTANMALSTSMLALHPSASIDHLNGGDK